MQFTASVDNHCGILDIFQRKLRASLKTKITQRWLDGANLRFSGSRVVREEGRVDAERIWTPSRAFLGAGGGKYSWLYSRTAYCPSSSNGDDTSSRRIRLCPSLPTNATNAQIPNIPFTNNAGIPRLHARSKATRSRSSSISIIVNQAVTCFTVKKEQTTTLKPAVAAPGYQQFIGAPRKPSLKTVPTGFEPNLPQTNLLSSNEESSSASESGADDDDDAATSSESASLSSTEESCLPSFESEEDSSSSPLSERRLSFVVAPVPHTTMQTGVRLIPHFSQPRCRLEPVSASVEYEAVEDDVCDRVRFVVPDDTHLRQSLDNESEPADKLEEPTWVTVPWPRREAEDLEAAVLDLYFP
ncbi:hypothetical protein C8F01DRAFT_1236647 [Mycena amicta]|nr:hypothetical protein C8F01DRAFT_1236647 [Mycena amicta]